MQGYVDSFIRRVLPGVCKYYHTGPDAIEVDVYHYLYLLCFILTLFLTAVPFQVFQDPSPPPSPLPPNLIDLEASPTPPCVRLTAADCVAAANY